MSSRAVARLKTRPHKLTEVDETVFKALNLQRFVDCIESREDEIIVAAFRCISTVGIAATTTRAVAKRAGMNLGAIHYYFKSKDELMLGVLKQLMKHKIKTFGTIRRSGLTPSRKIYYLLRSGSDFMQEKEEVVATISLWGHAVAQGGLWQSTYRKFFDELREELKAIIDEGIKSSDFIKTDSKVMAETIIVAVQGISMHYVMTPTDFENESLTDRLIEVFSRLLGIDRH